MKCCGKERSSAYCPDCGNPLQIPLQALLRHLRNQAKHYREHADNQEKNTEAIRWKGKPEKLRRYCERMRSLERKWQGWVDEIERLMKNQSGPQPQEAQP